MSDRLPSSPTAKNFADLWVREVLQPAVESLAGSDGQVKRADLDAAALQGVASFASDDLAGVFDAQGSGAASVDALLEAGRQYALAHASDVAGSDGVLSVTDAMMLPAELQEDFAFLRTGAISAERVDGQGYRFSQRVLSSVAEKYGIEDLQSLLDKAIERGSSDRYLNRSELDAAAESLSAEPAPSTEGFRWTPSVMARVMATHGLNDEDALLMEAAKHDDGNRYLKRSELEAAAKVLASQSPGAQGPEIGIISDIDKTIIPKHGRNQPVPVPYPGIQALLHELEFGGGGQAGDLTYVTARGPQRVVDIPDYFEEHEIPSGPIETGTSGIPWLAEPEKVRDVSRTLDANPDQSFVLLGDTSHRDPEVYKTIVAKYPGRIKAAFIHKVNDTVRPERVEGLHLVEDYAEAAAILFGEGIIDEAAARRIMNAAQVEGLDITDAQIDLLLEEHRP